MLFTIGHSTHPLGRLIELLGEHEVGRLVDVRTAPRSRRTPQFNTEALGRDLPAASVDYLHLPELGGWRTPWSSAGSRSATSAPTAGSHPTS